MDSLSSETKSRCSRKLVIAIGSIVFILAVAAGAVVWILNQNSKGDTSDEKDVTGIKGDSCIEIDLNDYITCSFTGYNGFGRASFTLDEDKLKKDTSDMAGSFKKLRGYIDGELTSSDHLSNGDKVTFVWKCHEKKALSDCGVELSCESKELVVSGLTQVSTFNPFYGIGVDFSGVNGEGVAKIIGGSGDPSGNLTFVLSKKDHLKNGENVTVSFQWDYDDREDDFVEKYHCLPSVREVVYSVSGLTDPMEVDETREGFLFPDSDTQLIDPALIAALSDDDLRMAINEIWARNGYVFRNKDILDYYKQFSWYNPTVSADEWDKNGQEHYLNVFELKNIDVMTKEREKREG